MKVLLINSEHTLGGGAYTVYLNTAELLKKVGVQVIFFAQHSQNEISCDQIEYFSKENTQANSFQYVRNRFYNQTAANSLQKLIEVEHPDVAHAHLIWGCLAPSILDVLKRNNIPVVHTVHDYAMVCSKVTLRSFEGEICERCSCGKYWESVKTKCHKGSLIRSIVSTAEFAYRNKYHHPVNLISHFIFVSNFCSDQHCKMDGLFENASKTILYNIPNNLVSTLSREQLSDTFNSYYLYYGRLATEKGIDTLISVFIKHPELRLKIVGTGPLESSLMSRCNVEKANNIEFLGFKSGMELYEIVENAKYVCVPSEWYENNPMTIIEAYTLGTPVIAARIGGIPEIVEDYRTGFLFNSGSIKELDAVLISAEGMNKEQYMCLKQEAKRYSSIKFNRERYIKQLMSIYRHLILQKKRYETTTVGI